jgi:hypothetical protein
VSSEEHKKFVERKRREYKTFEPIFSHALNELVFFNAHGFNHLIAKRGIPRTISEQIYKLSLLSFVVHVISEPVRINNKRVGYISLEKEIGERTIKVILKQNSSGKLMFWSVMKMK